MLPRPLRALWGDLSSIELKMFGLLSWGLFFIVGALWMTRTMKNAIFMDLVGSSYLGYAKMASPVILTCLLLLYSKLVDYFEKQQLVYLIAPFYAILFLVISYGLSNTYLSRSATFGWVLYFIVDSFGPIMVTLFWSFVASSMDTAMAKKGYSIILCGAQLGAILGNVFSLNATRFGLSRLFLIGGIAVCVIPFIIKIFVTNYPGAPKIQRQDEPKATGILEGLRLLFSRSYLMGILVIATVYEVIGTIFDIQMNTLAQQHFVSPTNVTEFLATYGLLANLLSFFFSLVGTSFLIRTLGLRICLVLFPMIVGCLVGGVWFFYGLWTLFVAMVTLRGFEFALNNPCKEIMYIPTSRDIKFKTKSWIDTLGQRSAKGLGGFISTRFSTLTQLANYGTIISLCIVGGWIFVATYVGKTNQTLVQENKVIE
jgi:ATP:ADP antiporter, AAA family